MLPIFLMKKQFKLDSISSGELFRVEISLKKLLDKDQYILDKEKYLLTVDSSDDIINKALDEIHSINEDIEIIEREFKPVKRKVLILRNLDCANCANTIERRAKRTIENDMISVDFSTGKFIIETTSDSALENLKENVKKIALDVDSNIEVLDLDEADSKEEVEEGLSKGRKRELIVAGVIFLLGFITKTIFNIIKFDDGLVFGENYGERYLIYNISVETGELLEPEEFIELCGLTDEEFFTLADASFATIADGYKTSLDEEYREKTIRDIYENNKELLSYEYLTPFFSPDGHLCFEGYIFELGDQGADHHMIDTETQQIIELVPVDVM